MDHSSHPCTSGGIEATSQSEKAPRSPEEEQNPAPPDTKPPPRDIEEGSDAYHPGGFHPVYIGDVYNHRYEIIDKIGYGVYSTVWVVKDLQNIDSDRRKYLALKVLSGICYHTGYDVFEREILAHLRDGDREAFGYKHICHLLDDFEHEGPNGKHVCLVFELYGETLSSFGTLFDESMIPTALMRRFTIQLLCALDFAHSHGVIHTDITPSNIFVKFRDHSLIESKYLKTRRVAQQDRNEEKYTVIPSFRFQNCYFTSADDLWEFDIALGDWGVASWTDKHLTENIQPVALRAPEVLIKAPWDEKADFWNLGAVLLEVYRAIRMFSGCVPRNGPYEVREHLAEIVAFFGPFPQSLLEKGNQEIVQDIFDEEGKVRGMPSQIPPLGSEVIMPGLRDEIRADFESFLRAMMKIEPSERATAEDLLRFPFLRALPPKGEWSQEKENNEGAETETTS
ncbi:serine/threonine protein kinase [Hypoxylon argillaceum]|nr:serine/threonine protein kinase [Hypoxylon argillaceum]